MTTEIERLTDRWAYPRKGRRGYPTGVKDTELLFELVMLAGYRTDPGNPNSMGAKDENAARAIVVAGQLLGPLLEWAIDHITGRMMLRRESCLAPQSHARVDERLAKRMALRSMRANSHENEWRGSSYGGDDPRVNRELIEQFLLLLSLGMDFKAGKEVSLALRALQKGEIWPELERVASKRTKNSTRLDKLKLLALGHVEFRLASSLNREKAMNDVCNAFNIDGSTIKQWSKNNCERLSSIDPSQAHDRLFAARQVGLLVAAKSNPGRRGELYGQLKNTDFKDKTALTKIERAARHYSQNKLEADAAEYNRLMAQDRPKAAKRKSTKSA